MLLAYMHERVHAIMVLAMVILSCMIMPRLWQNTCQPDTTYLSIGCTANHTNRRAAQISLVIRNVQVLNRHARYSWTSVSCVKSCITVTASTNSKALCSHEHCHTRQDQRYDFWNLARAPGPPNLQTARAMSAHQLSYTSFPKQSKLHCTPIVSHFPLNQGCIACRLHQHMIALTSHGLQLSLLQ